MTSFRVLRQDEHGNKFVIARGLSESAAKEMVETFEARGHKQFYWYEREQAK